MISIRNRTRSPASYQLTMDCVCAKLPASRTKRTVTQYVATLKNAVNVVEEVDFPPTLTIGAKATVSELPDEVASAPEIKAAVARGELLILKDKPAPVLKVKPDKADK